jgi:hypothetical protein
VWHVALTEGNVQGREDGGEKGSVHESDNFGGGGRPDGSVAFVTGWGGGGEVELPETGRGSTSAEEDHLAVVGDVDGGGVKGDRTAGITELADGD